MTCLICSGVIVCHISIRFFKCKALTLETPDIGKYGAIRDSQQYNFGSLRSQPAAVGKSVGIGWQSGISRVI
jgi:hypothetical protein